jgi:hypothetical protein
MPGNESPSIPRCPFDQGCFAAHSTAAAPSVHSGAVKASNVPVEQLVPRMLTPSTA